MRSFRVKLVKVEVVRLSEVEAVLRAQWRALLAAS